MKTFSCILLFSFVFIGFSHSQGSEMYFPTARLPILSFTIGSNQNDDFEYATTATVFMPTINNFIIAFNIRQGTSEGLMFFGLSERENLNDNNESFITYRKIDRNGSTISNSYGFVEFASETISISIYQNNRRIYYIILKRSS